MKQINRHHNFDWITITIYMVLVLGGLMSIYSASLNMGDNNIYSLNNPYSKQIVFIFISAISAFLILKIDGKFIAKIGYLIYALSIISLILVLFIGKEVGGAKAWFDFGAFGIQPAEFAKFGTIMALAKYIHDKDIYLDKVRDLLNVTNIILIPVLFILLQPDAGSALVFGSLIIMFFREGFPLKYVLIFLIIGIISLMTLIVGAPNTITIIVLLAMTLGFILIKHKKRIISSLLFLIFGALIVSLVEFSYNNILQSHQRERIDIILNKENNSLGSGYNLNQSLIAIGSGGFAGKGYLNGTQTKFNFVPEQNTDFIFCTVGEELGFLGCILILSLFLALIIRLIVLSEKQTSRFSRVTGYSLVSILFAHIFINISMTIGLLPVIGIPLPFFSYGGSSLISFSILLFTFIKLDACRMERF